MTHRKRPKPICVSDAASYLARKVFQQSLPDGPSLKCDRVQKLLFYAEATHYFCYARRLYTSDPIAKKNGPTYESVDKLLALVPDEVPAPAIPSYIIRILDAVFDTLHDKSTEDIIGLTRTELPWRICQEDDVMFEYLMMQWFGGMRRRPTVAAIVECIEHRCQLK